MKNIQAMRWHPGETSPFYSVETIPGCSPQPKKFLHYMTLHVFGSLSHPCWRWESWCLSTDSDSTCSKCNISDKPGKVQVWSLSSGSNSSFIEPQILCNASIRGGAGWFGPRQMQKAFEEGTAALKVGELSGVVDTDSGVHIILRTG